MELTKRQAEALRHIPDRYKPLTERAWRQETRISPREVIKAKCQECCGYSEVVTRIRECTVSPCPLWAIRPYQTDIDAEE